MKALKNLKLTCGGIELHEGWLQHGHDSVHLTKTRIMNDNDNANKFDNDNKEYNVGCHLTFLALKSMISSSMPELKLNMEGTPGDQVPTS